MDDNRSENDVFLLKVLAGSDIFVNLTKTEHIKFMFHSIAFQLAAIFLTLVLVEGRMVTRREQKEGVVNVRQAGRLISRVEVEENANKRVVRQAGEGGGEAGPFDLFGQVLNSFGEKETGGGQSGGK